jgi:hypothetical protein
VTVLKSAMAQAYHRTRTPTDAPTNTQ